MKSSNRLFEYTRSTLILFFHSTYCVGVTPLKWTEPTAEVYSDSVSPHFLSAADRMILRLLSLLTAAALVHSGELWINLTIESMKIFSLIFSIHRTFRSILKEKKTPQTKQRKTKTELLHVSPIRIIIHWLEGVMFRLVV